MAEIQKKTRQTKPKANTFLGSCFGFSKKVSEKKTMETVGSNSRRKTRWFSWARFRVKKSGTKTVPVETTVSEKSKLGNKIPASTKSKSNQKSKSGKPASKTRVPVSNNKPPSQIPVAVLPVVSDQAPEQNPQETTNGPSQNIILENRDHLDTSKDATCQKRLSFCRKLESIRTGCNQPGSPDSKSKSARHTISHSVSLPVPNQEKRTVNPSTTLARGTLKKPNPQKDASSGKKLDPVIGLSIVMVTVMIMLVWGRVCAILCTAAWFYFIPRLRTVVDSNVTIGNNMNSNGQNYDSEEYKKKVVLEGFLERNHRGPV